ncbi:unnamed protein product, partial [Schistocephalus solidus]|uniref:Dimer_Tnp_hAT domain-containing protein n=1 Tax=Schistocephalus solidus TaxID=70667 RepID=A0A183T3T9_SCHSO
KSYILPFGDIIKQKEQSSLTNEDAQAEETSAVSEVLETSNSQEDFFKVTPSDHALKLQPVLQNEKTACGFAKWEALKVCPKTLLQHAQVFNGSSVSDRPQGSRMVTRGLTASDTQRMSLEEGKDEETADIHKAEAILKAYKDRLVLVVEEEAVLIKNEELDRDAALVDTKECISVRSTLRNEFSSRFTDVLHSQEFKLFSTPFDFPFDDTPSDVQMELIELQASEVLLSKFTSCTTLIDFYRQLPQAQFPMLLARAKRVIAMFGSTYSCEQLFSKMKFCKNKLRSQLTDNRHNDILLLNSSSLEPDIVSVSKSMQHHVSH